MWADDVQRDPFWVWDGKGGGPKSTNIPVAQGDTVTITAEGKIWSGLAIFGENGPKGFEYPKHKPPAGATLANAPAFSLLGGWDNGEWCYVGESRNKEFRVAVHVRRKQHPELHGVGSTAG